jgi:hypothetical protein
MARLGARTISTAFALREPTSITLAFQNRCAGSASGKDACAYRTTSGKLLITWKLALE